MRSLLSILSDLPGWGRYANLLTLEVVDADYAVKDALLKHFTDPETDLFRDVPPEEILKKLEELKASK